MQGHLTLTSYPTQFFLTINSFKKETEYLLISGTAKVKIKIDKGKVR